MTLLPEGKLYIDGKLRDATGGGKFEDINPWTGEVVGYAPDGTAEDMDEAIAAARRAFDTTDWSANSNSARRVELVRKLAALMNANRDKLLDIAIREGGAAMGACNVAIVDGPLSFFDPLLAVYDTIEWEKPMPDKEGYSGAAGRLHGHIEARARHPVDEHHHWRTGGASGLSCWRHPGGERQGPGTAGRNAGDRPAR